MTRTLVEQVEAYRECFARLVRAHGKAIDAGHAKRAEKILWAIRGVDLKLRDLDTQGYERSIGGAGLLL